MKKATLTTVKSFIKKNANNLYLIRDSSFNGMTDGIEKVDLKWRIDPSEIDLSNKRNWGINGVVIASWNSITELENGFSIWNCCGGFSIVTL